MDPESRSTENKPIVLSTATFSHTHTHTCTHTHAYPRPHTGPAAVPRAEPVLGTLTMDNTLVPTPSNTHHLFSSSSTH